MKIIKNRKFIIGIISTVLVITASFSAFGQLMSEDNWAKVRSEYDKIVLAPGSDESQLNFAWYSTNSDNPELQMVKADEEFVSEKTFMGTNSTAYKDNSANIQYYSNKVTVTGIEPSTEYKYRYKINENEWSEVYSYTSKNTSSQLDFIAVGDVQIGIGNGGAKSDTERWNKTLKLACETLPNASFILSMGDQVDANQEYDQYAGFLYPNILRSLPIATIAGNHDCDVPNLIWHFNNPNMTKYGETNAGGDYYFTAGDVLIISLNSNAVLKSSKSNNAIAVEHRKCIEEAIASAPYAKWRIITFHQDIYGYPDHYSDPEVAKCREQLYPIIDDYDIDVVLTGHGHNYTRSLQMEDNMAVSTDSLYYSDNVSVVNPSGTVYFELSTSASKNYDNNKAGFNSHIAKSFAESGVQSYSVVSVTSETFEIKTYRTDSNTVYDTYKITKDDRTKLDKAIEKANEIINSGEYTEIMLTSIKSQLTESLTISQNCTRKEAYDAAVLLEKEIKLLEPVLFGDINKDGDVAVNDLIYLKKHVEKKIELSEEQLKAADVNHDGDITIADVEILQDYLAAKIDNLD